MIAQNVDRIFNEMLKNQLKTPNIMGITHNYISFFMHQERITHEKLRKALALTYEFIDKTFKSSPERRKNYYTKGIRPRTLMTLWGEIRFEREYYVPKNGGEGFFYVDRLLDLPRRDYYDPLIKALLIEHAASDAYGKAGKVVGAMIGERFTFNNSSKIIIPRQTVRNVILSASLDDINNNEPMKRAETLYIQMDEKYVALQRENAKKHEVKVAVLYTDIERVGKKRHQLINRKVFATTNKAFTLRRQIADYIASTYDTDALKQIILTGDGAEWIKKSPPEFLFHPNMSVQFVLDRFHTQQAINHMSLDETKRLALSYCVRQDEPHYFESACDSLKTTEPERETIISEKQRYLTGNWQAIQNQKLPLFKGCSMEGHISHIIAALFASRPKAYSMRMLNTLIELRLAHVNNDDIKRRYLEFNTDYFHQPLIDIETAHKDYTPATPATAWQRELMKYINTQRFDQLKYI